MRSLACEREPDPSCAATGSGNRKLYAELFMSCARHEENVLQHLRDHKNAVKVYPIAASHPGGRFCHAAGLSDHSPRTASPDNDYLLLSNYLGGELCLLPSVYNFPVRRKNSVAARGYDTSHPGSTGPILSFDHLGPASSVPDS